jgi:hypothetical protein
MGLIGGVIGLVFLITFAYIFFANLNTTTLLPAGSVGSISVGNMTSNFSKGVENVSLAIPTVFQIGVFVLIVIVLIIAYVVAKNNGLLDGKTVG